ncbi:MAG TPA: hypothetical protein VHQ90_13960 [Thermoanaerobaculia bacterium]|nr:hypothetical protein [Thermoanaerobaculia bacterium]
MDPNYSPMPQKKQTSPWVWVGVGCAALVIFGIIAVLSVGYIAFRGVKGMEEGFSNPAVREQRTRALLPYRELPAGYEPVGTMSIPFVMDLAILSDKDPDAPRETTRRQDSPRIGAHGFIYMRIRTFKPAARTEMDRYLSGEGAPPPWFQTGNVRLNSHELVGHGKLTVGDRQIAYSSRRGDIIVNGRKREGLTTVMGINCPGSDRLHMALWFGPDPAPGKPATAEELAGSSADPKAIADFLGHFDLCGGKGG